MCVGTIRCTNSWFHERVEDFPAEIGTVGSEASSEAKRPGLNSGSQRPGEVVLSQGHSLPREPWS